MKYVLFVVILFAASCQNAAEETGKDDTLVSNQQPDTSDSPSVDSVNKVALNNGTHCFLYTKNRDTISMHMLLKDSAASGDLIYNFYEKDKNKGTFTGILKNDTLLANYTFSSEGMRSVRQVVFLLKGDILLSGSGSMKEQGNKMVFSNKKDISFDNSLILKSVDCSALSFK